MHWIVFWLRALSSEGGDASLVSNRRRLPGREGRSGQLARLDRSPTARYGSVGAYPSRLMPSALSLYTSVRSGTPDRARRLRLVPARLAERLDDQLGLAALQPCLQVVPAVGAAVSSPTWYGGSPSAAGSEVGVARAPLLADPARRSARPRR